VSPDTQILKGRHILRHFSEIKRFRSSYVSFLRFLKGFHIPYVVNIYFYMLEIYISLRKTFQLSNIFCIEFAHLKEVLRNNESDFFGDFHILPSEGLGRVDG
jgi:hypothetical protein